MLLWASSLRHELVFGSWLIRISVRCTAQRKSLFRGFANSLGTNFGAVRPSDHESTVPYLPPLQIATSDKHHPASFQALAAV